MAVLTDLAVQRRTRFVTEVTQQGAYEVGVLSPVFP